MVERWNWKYGRVKQLMTLMVFRANMVENLLVKSHPFLLITFACVFSINLLATS